MSWRKRRAARILRRHSPTLATCRATDETGTSLYNLKEVAKKLGVRTSALEVTFEGLKEIRLPALLLFDRHYVIVTKVGKKGITVINPIPPLVLEAKGKGKKVSAKGRWQFEEEVVPKEQLGSGWKGAVLVVLGRYWQKGKGVTL